MENRCGLFLDSFELHKSPVNKNMTCLQNSMHDPTLESCFYSLLHSKKRLEHLSFSDMFGDGHIFNQKKRVWLYDFRGFHTELLFHKNKRVIIWICGGHQQSAVQKGIEVSSMGGDTCNTEWHGNCPLANPRTVHGQNPATRGMHEILKIPTSTEALKIRSFPIENPSILMWLPC